MRKRNTTTAKELARQVVLSSTGQDLDAWLRDLYVTRRYTLEEIGNSLGVSRELIRLWLVDAGVSREDRDSLPPLVAA
jgi:hypothetical protein